MESRQTSLDESPSEECCLCFGFSFFIRVQHFILCTGLRVRNSFVYISTASIDCRWSVLFVQYCLARLGFILVDVRRGRYAMLRVCSVPTGLLSVRMNGGGGVSISVPRDIIG